MLVPLETDPRAGCCCRSFARTPLLPLDLWRTSQHHHVQKLGTQSNPASVTAFGGVHVNSSYFSATAPANAAIAFFRLPSMMSTFFVPLERKSRLLGTKHLPLPEAAFRKHVPFENISVTRKDLNLDSCHFRRGAGFVPPQPNAKRASCSGGDAADIFCEGRVRNFKVSDLEYRWTTVPPGP